MDVSFIKGSAKVTMGLGISKVLNMVFYILVARMYSTSEYGFIRYIIAMALLVAIPLTAGLPEAAARYIAEFRNDKVLRNTYFSNVIALILGVLTVVLVVLVVPVTLNQLHKVIFIVILGPVVSAIYVETARGFIDSSRIAVYSVSANAIKLVLIAIPFLLIGYVSPLYPLILFGFSSIIALFFLGPFKPLKVKFSIKYLSKPVLKDIAAFAFPLLASFAAFSVMSQMDMIFIKHFLSLEDTGIYSVAKTMTMAFGIVPLGVATILMPTVVQYKTQHETKKRLLESISLTILISFFILAIFWLFGKEIITMVFTTQYIQAQSVLIPLSIGAVFLALYTIVGALLQAFKRTDILAKAAWVACGIFVIGNLLFIPRWGIVGAGFAYCLAHACALALVLLALKQVRGII